jgi:hypothetical protein
VIHSAAGIDPKRLFDERQIFAYGWRWTCRKSAARKNMIKKFSSVLQSRKVTGFLWILAALLMGVPPILSGGNRSLIAIGAMFLIFGIVSLRREPKT